MCIYFIYPLLWINLHICDYDWSGGGLIVSTEIYANWVRKEELERWVT